MSGISDKISVIIVTYNSEPVLPGCLEHLKTALRSLSNELIVIDNGSTDGSIDTAQRLFPDCRVVSNNANLGFAAACNRGAEAAEGEYLLFVNPDLEIDPDAIVNLLKTYESHSNAGLLSGRLRFNDGAFQPSCRNFPTYSNLLFSRGSFVTSVVRGAGQKVNTIYTLGDATETVAVPAVAGTFIMVKTDLFDEAGGFDARFFMYMEDTDLSFRVHGAGYKNLFVPSAGAVHHWGTGSPIGKLKRKYYHHRSLWTYFMKHQANAFSILVLPLLLVINFLIVLVLPDKKGR